MKMFWSARASRVFGVCVCWLLLCSFAQAAINTTEMEKAIKTTQTNLKKAQDAFTKATQELHQAEAAKKLASKELEQIRVKVTAESRKNPEVQAALAEQVEAKQKYDNVAKPILDNFHQTDAYLKVSAEAQKASLKIQQLQADKELTNDEKSKQMQSLAETSIQPAKLDQEEVVKHTTTKAAREALNKVNAHLLEIEKVNHKALEENSEVRNAQEQAKSAQEALLRARQELANKKNDLAAGEDILAEQQQVLNNAKQQNAMMKARPRRRT